MANAAAETQKPLNIKHFRKILEGERNRVLDQFKHLDANDPDSATANELDEVANYDQHMADQATTTFLREQDQAIQVGLRSELEQIDGALERIGEGTYGACERCGAAISSARLEVLPYTPYCISCAGEIEARL
ncbi:MAG: TraR/DksA C4-type zinc finger protein [Actinomycetota bacterium]